MKRSYRYFRMLHWETQKQTPFPFQLRFPYYIYIQRRILFGANMNAVRILIHTLIIL